MQKEQFKLSGDKNCATKNNLKIKNRRIPKFLVLLLPKHSRGAFSQIPIEPDYKLPIAFLQKSHNLGELK